MQARGVVFSKDCWRVGTAIDCKKTSQQVLAAHADDSRPCHIFSDLNDLLSPGRRSQLDSMMPTARESPEVKAESYSNMLDAMLGDLSGTFCKCAPCVLHPGESDQDGCCAKEVIVGSADVPKDGELTVWAAGTSCVNFSKRGKRECTSGSAMRPWKIWVALVRQHKPHMIFHEITISRKALAMLREDLSDLYCIHAAHVSPVDIGWPVDRPRQICLLTLKSTITFVGNWTHWFELFACQVNISVAKLLAAPTEYTRSVMAARARSHGHHVHPDQTVPIECCLSPCQYKHHLLYLAAMAENMGPDGTFCYDVEQHPDFNMSGPFVPTLVSHGTVVVHSSSYTIILGGKQHMVAMGEPLFDAQQMGHNHVSSFADLARSDVLAESTMKDLAGNAFHEAVFGLMLLYALAFTIKDTDV